MAVLVEGISVIVRIASIHSKIPDGWSGFERIVPNNTLCVDGELARVGFMATQEVEAFVNLLIELGLTFLKDGKPIDIAVADQQLGLKTACTWLMFSHLTIDRSGGKVGVCWLTSEDRIPVAGIHMPVGWRPGGEIKLSTPQGWSYEDSLSKQLGYIQAERLNSPDTSVNQPRTPLQDKRGVQKESGINMDKSSRDTFRYFLKDNVRQEIDFSNTDQARGMAPPPLEKPIPEGIQGIDLVPAEELHDISVTDVFTAIANRKSRRAFNPDPLTLKELSFLLWATQGVRKIAGPGAAFRVVPSAGCRHALETYLCVFNVAGLAEGIYRYLPVEHQLLLVSQPAGLSSRVSEAALGQDFVGKSAVTFMWTAIPYRMEWRYDIAAHKVIALDAGHVCQNLYTACEAIHAGTCAVAAYHQELVDNLLGVDGNEEFTIYLAPVGKRKGD